MSFFLNVRTWSSCQHISEIVFSPSVSFLLSSKKHCADILFDSDRSLLIRGKLVGVRGFLTNGGEWRENGGRKKRDNKLGGP